MGQKHQTSREFQTPFTRATFAKIRRSASQHVRACTAHDGDIEMVRAYGLRTFPIMAPDYILSPAPKSIAQALAIDPLRLKTLISGTKTAFLASKMYDERCSPFQMGVPPENVRQ